MPCIDLRYVILVAMNLLKFEPWVWDPFHTIGEPGWMKICLVAMLFLVFPFIPIQIHVPLITPSLLPIQFGQLSAPLAVALMAAALVLPRALVWYAFPIIIIISSCFTLPKRFVNWFYSLLTAVPVLNITIRPTIHIGWQVFQAPQGPQPAEIFEAIFEHRNPPALELIRVGDHAIQDVEVEAGLV